MGKRITILKKNSHQSLLETLEKNDIKLYSECCQGYCGSCKSTLIEGKIYYPQEPLTQLEENECLPCCAYPLSDVTIEIN